MLQEVYFMFCDIFKIIETRQLVNSILNLPLELLYRLEKLSRFVRNANFRTEADIRPEKKLVFGFGSGLRPKTQTQNLTRPRFRI
jgi:hypothetical protein